MHHRHVGGLSVRPLHVMIDVRAGSAVPNVSSTGMHPRSHPGIRSQMTCTRESINITNLRENDHTEDEGDPRQGLDQFGRSSGDTILISSYFRLGRRLFSGHPVSFSLGKYSKTLLRILHPLGHGAILKKE